MKIDFGDANYIKQLPKEEDKKEEDFESEANGAEGDGNINERRGTFVGTAYYVSPEML